MIVFVLLNLCSVAYSAREIQCSRLDDPLNGRVNVEHYSVGGIARYSCNYGYEIQGHDAAICLSNGEFDPSPTPVCAAVTCPEVNYFPNGYVQHINDGRQSNTYTTYNMYSCYQGYKLEGRFVRLCEGSGEWEGEEPFCREIICAPLGPLYNGDVEYTNRRRTWGTMAYFECKPRSDMFPETEMSFCEDTGEWSDSMPECLRQATIGPIPRGYVYVGGSRQHLRHDVSLKHNTSILLKCDGRSEMYSTVERRYMDTNQFSSKNINGTWTPALPECVFKRCNTKEKRFGKYIFSFAANGSTVPVKVDHKTQLHVSCIANYEFEDQRITASTVCDKGRLSDEPKCVPASCSASLEPNIYLVNGASEKIMNTIRIRHGTKVFYNCSNPVEYELFFNGYKTEVSDECLYGEWTKNVNPICQERRCILPDHKGAIFSEANGNIVSGSNTYIDSRESIHLNCSSGYILVKDNNQQGKVALNKRVCLRGKWTNPIKCMPAPCTLTIHEGSDFWLDRGGTKEMIHNNQTIPSSTQVFISCREGYQFRGMSGNHDSGQKEKYSICERGSWSSNHGCEPAPCTLTIHEGSDFWLDRGGTKEPIHSHRQIPSGTKVFISCQKGYQFRGTSGNHDPGEKEKYSICERGSWSSNHGCEPAPCNLTLHEGSDFWLDRDGMIKVIHSHRQIPSGTKVFIRCRKGYQFRGTSGNHDRGEKEKYSVCERGSWSSNHGCEPASCKFVKHEGSDFWFIKANKKHLLNESGSIPNGTWVYISCHHGYRFKLEKGQTVEENKPKHSVCWLGNWTQIYKCEIEQNFTTNRSVEIGTRTDAIEATTEADFNPRHSVRPNEDITGESSHEKSVTENITVTAEPGVSSKNHAEQNQSDLNKSDMTPTRTSTIVNEVEIKNDTDSTKIPEESSYKTDCVVPKDDVYDLDGYSPGDSVSDGSVIDISCRNDHLDYFDDTNTTCENGKWLNMPVCKEGFGSPESESNGRMNCDIPDGIATQLYFNPLLYHITCRDGFNLNYQVQVYECKEGFFYPSLENFIGKRAECSADDCQVPYNMSSDIKVQNENGTFYSKGTNIPHMEKVTLLCPEQFEPVVREISCYAGKFLQDNGNLTTLDSQLCRKGACRVPYTMSSDIKVQNENGTYYTKGMSIPHMEKVKVTLLCPEQLEPVVREISCNAGMFVPDSGNHITLNSQLCRKDACRVPYNMSSNIKVQNENGTYYTKGISIPHMETVKVTLSCPEHFEPVVREVSCYAGKFLSDSGNLTTLDSHLMCRKAHCDPGCIHGVCVADGRCECEEGKYGPYCEKAVTYYIHFLLAVPYNHHRERYLEGKIINLYSDGFKTSDAVMVYNTYYREKNDQCYVFRFVAEELDHISSLSFTLPFQRSELRIQKIKLELRERSVVYSATQHMENGGINTYRMNEKKAYIRAFNRYNGYVLRRETYQHFPAWKRYQYWHHGGLEESCKRKCYSESAFTCATFVLYFRKNMCYTLAYSSVEYPEYFRQYSVVASTYTRHYNTK